MSVAIVFICVAVIPVVVGYLYGRNDVCPDTRPEYYRWEEK